MIIFKKEKEVIELILQHVDKVEECIKVAIKTLQAYLKDDIQNAKKLARDTDRLEGEADGEKSIQELLKALDDFIPLPEREVDKPFLMPVENVRTR